MVGGIFACMSVPVVVQLIYYLVRFPYFQDKVPPCSSILNIIYSVTRVVVHTEKRYSVIKAL